MTRFICIVWIVSAGFAASAQSPASECPKKSRAEFRLQANEFSVSAYDVSQGLLALNPKFTVQRVAGRLYPIEFIMPSTPIYLAIGPEHLKWWLEGGLRQVELLVDAEKRLDEPMGPHRARCDRWIVRQIRLLRGQVVLAQHNIPQGIDGGLKERISSKVAVERGSLGARMVRHVGRNLAIQCLKESRQNGGRIQGALSLQVEVDLLGRPLPPLVVVDGLVNHYISQCLRTKLLKSTDFWAQFRPDTRAYFTLYFRTRQQGAAHPKRTATPILE